MKLYLKILQFSEEQAHGCFCIAHASQGQEFETLIPFSMSMQAYFHALDQGLLLVSAAVESLTGDVTGLVDVVKVESLTLQTTIECYTSSTSPNPSETTDTAHNTTSDTPTTNAASNNASTNTDQDKALASPQPATSAESPTTLPASSPATAPENAK